MASTYPSAVASLTNPLGNQFQNSPSHSSIHANENTEIQQIQTFVGTLPASAVGTLMYDVRSPASGGGGHVQTAILGGTGQTTFLVGDVLVATSSSSLGRIAVGSDHQVLTANSSVQGGVQWSGLNKIVVNTASVAYASGTASVEQVLFSASIAANTLGTSGAVRYTGYLQNFTNAIVPNNFTLRYKYGANTIGTAVVSILSGNFGNIPGYIQGTLVSRGDPSSQIGFIELKGQNNNEYNGTITNVQNLYAYTSGTSSIDSTVSQDLVITGQFAGTSSSIIGGPFIVEKIV